MEVADRKKVRGLTVNRERRADGAAHAAAARGPAANLELGGIAGSIDRYRGCIDRPFACHE